jgi:GNAT superfamily N-acetyltransferase
MTEEVFNKVDPITMMARAETIDFLSHHLDGYDDGVEHIDNAINYAMNTNPLAGGFILLFRENHKIIGAVIMNKTGMEAYIPANVVVYLAVHKDYRGNGLGKKLLKRAMQLTKGDIAIHIKKDKPIGFLCQEIGFKNEYLELRYYAK